MGFQEKIDLEPSFLVFQQRSNGNARSVDFIADALCANTSFSSQTLAMGFFTSHLNQTYNLASYTHFQDTI